MSYVANPPISYQVAAEAIAFYRDRHGYRYVEAPWYVERRAIETTLPKDATPCEVRVRSRPRPRDSLGYLVGSAEQGMVQLAMWGDLRPGKWVSAGPCFRDEPVLDYLRRTTFFKVELTQLLSPTISQTGVDAALSVMLETASGFFRSQGAKPVARLTAEGWDLEVNGVEVGSYGVRRYEEFQWVYGTGVALPRLCQARDR